MQAMTWFDNETDGIWSRPTGTALEGDYAGVRLEMIPAVVMPWATWKKEHPETLVLDTGESVRQPPEVNPFCGRRGDYVVWVSLGDSAKAYPFDTVSQDVVVNNHVGDVPVMVYENPEDKLVHIFVRRV